MVYDQEIGVSRRQPTAFGGAMDTRERQGQQTIGIAGAVSQPVQLFGHGHEFVIVRIPGGCGRVDDGLWIDEARQGIDMDIGIVAAEITKVQPQEAVDPKPGAEQAFDVLSAMPGVPGGRDY